LHVCAAQASHGKGRRLQLFRLVEPLTRDFGWSRVAVSGAISLGGLLAALVLPLIGPLLDRRGSRLVLCFAVLVNGVALLLLSLTPVVAGLLPAVLHCANELGRTVRPRHLWRIEQLVSRTPDRRGLDCHPRTDDWLGGDAADRTICDLA
jgi:predicted MFS family arabinose efflux permease